jgi:hypothetical protein
MLPAAQRGERGDRLQGKRFRPLDKRSDKPSNDDAEAAERRAIWRRRWWKADCVAVSLAGWGTHTTLRYSDGGAGARLPSGDRKDRQASCGERVALDGQRPVAWFDSWRRRPRRWSLQPTRGGSVKIGFHIGYPGKARLAGAFRPAFDAIDRETMRSGG